MSYFVKKKPEDRIQEPVAKFVSRLVLVSWLTSYLDSWLKKFKREKSRGVLHTTLIISIKS